MQFKLIVAASKDGIIGRPDGSMPWKLSDDFKHFRETTTGHPIVMGRKTLETLPGVLPNRRHIVMSRGDINYWRRCGLKNFNMGDKEQDIEFIKDFGELKEYCSHMSDSTLVQDQLEFETVYICGGEEIYKQALEELDISEIILSKVDAEFPEAGSDWARFEVPKGWRLDKFSSQIGTDEKNSHGFSIQYYVKG